MTSRPIKTGVVQYTSTLLGARTARRFLVCGAAGLALWRSPEAHAAAEQEEGEKAPPQPLETIAASHITEVMSVPGASKFSVRGRGGRGGGAAVAEALHWVMTVETAAAQTAWVRSIQQVARTAASVTGVGVGQGGGRGSGGAALGSAQPRALTVSGFSSRAEWLAASQQQQQRRRQQQQPQGQGQLQRLPGAALTGGGAAQASLAGGGEQQGKGLLRFKPRQRGQPISAALADAVALTAAEVRYYPRVPQLAALLEERRQRLAGSRGCAATDAAAADAAAVAAAVAAEAAAAAAAAAAFASAYAGVVDERAAAAALAASRGVGGRGAQGSRRYGGGGGGGSGGGGGASFARGEDEQLRRATVELLHFCAARGYCEALVRLKKAGASLAAKGPLRRTAVCHRCGACVPTLLDTCQGGRDGGCGAPLRPGQDCHFRATAAMMAALHGEAAAIRAIFELEAAALDERGDLGSHALHFGAASGSGEAVRALVECCASVDAADAIGWTALHVAALHGHCEALAELRQQGAHADERDRWAQTALHVAGAGGLLLPGQLLAPGSAGSAKRRLRRESGGSGGGRGGALLGGSARDAAIAAAMTLYAAPDGGAVAAPDDGGGIGGGGGGGIGDSGGGGIGDSGGVPHAEAVSRAAVAVDAAAAAAAAAPPPALEFDFGIDVAKSPLSAGESGGGTQAAASAAAAAAAAAGGGAAPFA